VLETDAPDISPVWVHPGRNSCRRSARRWRSCAGSARMRCARPPGAVRSRRFRAWRPCFLARSPPICGAIATHPRNHSRLAASTVHAYSRGPVSGKVQSAHDDGPQLSIVGFVRPWIFRHGRRNWTARASFSACYSTRSH
jgi:hypothetical protein